MLGYSVVFAQNPFGLIPKVLETIDMFALLIHQFFIMINPQKGCKPHLLA